MLKPAINVLLKNAADAIKSKGKERTGLIGGLIMNRRSFLKLVAVAATAPYLPGIAVPVEVAERIALNTQLQTIFDYTLKNMVLTPFMKTEVGSIIRIT